MEAVSRKEVVVWGGRALNAIGGVAIAGLLWLAGALWDGYQERGKQINSALDAIGIANTEIDAMKSRVDRNEGRIDALYADRR